MGVSQNFADIFQALLNTFCGYNIELISPKKKSELWCCKKSLYKLISYTSRTFLLLALIPKAFSSHDFLCDFMASELTRSYTDLISTTNINVLIFMLYTWQLNFG